MPVLEYSEDDLRRKANEGDLTVAIKHVCNRAGRQIPEALAKSLLFALVASDPDANDAWVSRSEDKDRWRATLDAASDLLDRAMRLVDTDAPAADEVEILGMDEDWQSIVRDIRKERGIPRSLHVALITGFVLANENGRPGDLKAMKNPKTRKPIIAGIARRLADAIATYKPPAVTTDALLAEAGLDARDLDGMSRKDYEEVKYRVAQAQRGISGR